MSRRIVLNGRNRMGAGAGPSFPEGSSANNSISELVLSNNSLYNLYSFAWKLVYLGEVSHQK